MLEKWFAGRHDWAPVPLRLSLGVIFFAHGAQKVLGWFGGYGWAGTMQFFTQKLPISAPGAGLVFLAEFFGGVALLVGGFTRGGALLPAGGVFVAALLIHLRHGVFLYC